MFIKPPEPSDEASRFIEAIEKSEGYPMNYAQLWAWRPDVFQAFAELRSQVTTPSLLTMRDQAVIVCAMASELGDAYCALAWSRKLAAEITADAAAAILANTDDPALTRRDRLLAQWTRKVVDDPNATSAADIDQLRAEGFGDKEVFEATIFIAFRLAFSTINDAMGLNPDRRLFDMVSEPVKKVVTFGRPVDSSP